MKSTYIRFLLLSVGLFYASPSYPIVAKIDTWRKLYKDGYHYVHRIFCYHIDTPDEKYTKKDRADFIRVMKSSEDAIALIEDSKDPFKYCSLDENRLAYFAIKDSPTPVINTEVRINGELPSSIINCDITRGLAEVCHKNNIDYEGLDFRSAFSNVIKRDSYEDTLFLAKKAFRMFFAPYLKEVDKYNDSPELDNYYKKIAAETRSRYLVQECSNFDGSLDGLVKVSDGK